ncbi:aspartate aminotransferase [Puccinia graminis f. sp. tritici CRL 75-36-700-3]|uniref:Aspartate aminotransferase n=1 Tax=Puccinia graminis f. sp. tritici (strain CRL 75-36-700-3 / race SCCL) TaxID=418459 RepID=H6QU76_PUCGT|nr:aspartate aminotransferase [Puccinia graminis f. sp. tritici CRL 75-36-700-3]EHS64539.1 aspartate aminotransferase [Puccinia graminis f. sp. tritici CRL 75-36-700-3]
MPSTQNILASLPLAPPESIFQLAAAYKADQFQEKVDLGVGAYRVDCGKRWVLPVVKTREFSEDEILDREYQPITA